MGIEAHFVNKFDDIVEKAYRKSMTILYVRAIVYSIQSALPFFIQATAFGYGWYLIQYNNLSVADLFKIYACTTFTSTILERVYDQMPDQKESRRAARTVFDILDRKSLIDSMEQEGVRPDEFNGNIRFESVHFAYPTRPSIKVLDGFNLDIKGGQTNALVGIPGN